MPNWSDDEGRCHFEVSGVPCYQSATGCPMHEVKVKKTERHPKVKLSAYEQCLNALNMTERDQRVEVEPKVLERLLKEVNRLMMERDKVTALKAALYDIGEMVNVEPEYRGVPEIVVKAVEEAFNEADQVLRDVAHENVREPQP